MKKRYVLGIIGLLLGTGLTPSITADIFSIVDDNTVNVQPGLGIVITYPTPGLWLFGNKLVNFSIIFIIGAFAIEADGKYIESIEFYLDDKLIGRATEEPFCCYCDFKHFGKGMIKAIGNDTLDHQWEDTLDVWYFKFL